MDPFDVFEQGEKRREPEPHEPEGAQKVLLRRVQYKEVEYAVQSDGEDNSAEGIDPLRALRLVERERERDADDRRREHVQERRANEAEVAREDRLHSRVARKRREEEER